MASDKAAKSCAECVMRQQGGGQKFGTHSDFAVNHPKCGSCCWARAVTGKGQLVDCIEYVQISDRR